MPICLEFSKNSGVVSQSFTTQNSALPRPSLNRRWCPIIGEVGASGRRYSRAFILHILKAIPTVDAASEGWETRDFLLRRLGRDTHLLTYSLQQGQRLTRRSTIWQSLAGRWRVIYHQGTIVTAEEDDVAPPRAS